MDGHEHKAPFPFTKTEAVKSKVPSQKKHKASSPKATGKVKVKTDYPPAKNPEKMVDQTWALRSKASAKKSTVPKIV